MLGYTDVPNVITKVLISGEGGRRGGQSIIV